MSSVIYRNSATDYPSATSSSGARISTGDGSQYLDMSGGAAVSLLGHHQEQVIQATQEQLDQLAYAHTAFFTSSPQELLAERICARFGEKQAKCYFTTGGSLANETAVKMAWQYWKARQKPKKQIVISRNHSYHGNTFLTLSLSGHGMRRAGASAPLLDWPRIGACYFGRESQQGESEQAYGQRMAQELEAAILKAGPENVAAFLCETVAGASIGVVAAVDGYFELIRKICDRYDVLLILDEVMCGSGRVGSFFAFESENISPDMVTIAKGIAGGYQPLGATIVNREVGETLAQHGFSHGFTYVGHPTACAAGLAVQNVLDEQDVLTTVKRKGEELLSVLNHQLGQNPHVADIRGRGLFIGVELAKDKLGYELPVAGALKSAAQQAGLLCYPGEFVHQGMYLPHVLLAPPVCVTAEEMSRAAEILSAVLLSELGEGKSY